MGKTKMVLSYQRAVLRPLCPLVAKSGCDVSVGCGQCLQCNNVLWKHTAFLPLASDNSLFKECCRQGKIATTRIRWVNRSGEIPCDKANQRVAAAALVLVAPKCQKLAKTSDIQQMWKCPKFGMKNAIDQTLLEQSNIT